MCAGGCVARTRDKLEVGSRSESNRWNQIEQIVDILNDWRKAGCILQMIEQLQNRNCGDAIGVGVQILAIGEQVVVQGSYGEWITPGGGGNPVRELRER